MTIQQETADLHLAASQAQAVIDAAAESIKSQRDALVGSQDAGQFNSNFYLADELSERLRRAASYVNTVVRQTLVRLEALGMQGSQPPPPLVLTPYGLLERTSGHVSYRDPAASQAIVAATATVVLNNRSTIDESQKPADVVSYYDGNRFRGSLGEALLYRLTFNVTSTDTNNTASEIRMWFDYGVPGVRLFEQVQQLVLGYGQVEPATYLLPVYIGPTFAQEGGRLMVESDGPVLIENVSYFVTRLHRSA